MEKSIGRHFGDHEPRGPAGQEYTAEHWVSEASRLIVNRDHSFGESRSLSGFQDPGEFEGTKDLGFLAPGASSPRRIHYLQ